MAATKIEWADSVWNPTVGCSVLSAGCTNCYAMKMAARLENMGGSAGHHYRDLTQTTKAGPVWNGAVRLVESALPKPLSWKKPRRIFVNSMSDLFHEALTDEQIDRVFAVMALAPQHTFQVLTKRADRMRAYMLGGAARRISGIAGGTVLVRWPLPQVWLGVSVEDQARADERIPELLAAPARVRFLSCEPLLGPVDLRDYLEPREEHGIDMDRPVGSRVGACVAVRPAVDWVIAGGESGPGARPMHPAWARLLRDQCAAAGVPFFFKQWGEFAPSGLNKERWIVRPDGSFDPDPLPNGLGRHAKEGFWIAYRVGKKAAGALLDGREHREFPA